MKSLTVQALSNNLFTDLTGKAVDALSNAQKAYEREQWLTKAMNTDKVPDLLHTIEGALLSLPAGDEVIRVFNKRTGKVDEKKKNHRDIAKASLKTAWKNAAKVVDSWQGTELNFKLCTPSFEVVGSKAMPTLQDKIVNLLGDSVDANGIASIMSAIDKAQQAVQAQIEQGAALRAEQRLFEAIGDDYRRLLTLGVSATDAIARTAAYMDVTSEIVNKAIGK